jgi:AraC-like DNA-binding protein
MEFDNDQRVERLLLHSRLSVSDVSSRLGFKDNSCFGRYFRKDVGMTPGSFRNICFTEASTNKN